MTAVIPELREALMAAAQEQATFASAREHVAGSSPSEHARSADGSARGRDRHAADEPVRLGSLAPGAARTKARRRPWHRGGLPLIAALLVGTGGIATATTLVVSQATKDRAEQLTKRPVPPAGKVSKLGEQMVATAREIQAELPYPPGMRDTYDWSKYSMGATLGTGGESRREIQLMSETRAHCLWRRYYVSRYDARDRRGMADAAAIMAQAPEWPATRRLERRSDANRPGDWRSVMLDEAGLAARGQLPIAMRDRILLNCTDGVDPRRRPGESTAEGLARYKREARAAGR